MSDTDWRNPVKINLKQKYFLVAFSSLVLFLVLGFVVHDLILRNMITPMPKREMMPPIFIAKIVDRINPSNKVKAIEELNSWQTNMPGPKLLLIDDKGSVLYPVNEKLNFDWDKIKKPENKYEYTKIDTPSMEGDFSPPKPGFFPPSPPPPGGGPSMGVSGGPPPPPPHEMGAREAVLIKLDDSQNLFLLVSNEFKNRPDMGPPGGGFGKDRKPFLPWIGIISMVISLILGVGVAISLIYSSVNKKVKLADEVITQLQHGNLKARFPITRHDEFGRAMLRFNTMAAEIENLVEHMRGVEKSRSKLIQELAHDLRTPIASLKSLMETLNLKGPSMKEETKKEFLDLSLKEVNYFERLVEDLLFLAQVTEPKYQMQKESILISAVMEDEARDVSFRINQNQKDIKLELDFSEISEQVVVGDMHLIRRLLRNALENAFSFSKRAVKVSGKLYAKENKIKISIMDDGPGFSAESLASFGERRVTRKLATEVGGRISVGLGSVIMKTIANVHRGEIKASNVLNENNQIQGSCLEITLPV